ncbi:hypothetical protein [Crystallibacter degradans]|uniref:hypothetical protein n=1 Tax=Crystallibacter degradans TaxID=2726743 RepID=UPI001474354D|nr:hypothetical protein [Arthrobacter sp. SF27]NMR28642.1 hypothetical protein [Arthrobacter sp. SF27]
MNKRSRTERKAAVNLDPALRPVLWVAILASFVAFLDGAIINVALPAMSSRSGPDPNAGSHGG